MRYAVSMNLKHYILGSDHAEMMHAGTAIVPMHVRRFFNVYMCLFFFDGGWGTPLPLVISILTGIGGGTNFFSRPGGPPVGSPSVLCEIPKRNFRIQSMEKRGEKRAPPI